MSANVTGILLIWALLASANGGRESPCSPAAETVLEAASEAALLGELAAAAAQLRDHYLDHRTCPELVVAAWAWDGWHAAQAAAARGGSDESLAGVRAALETLGPAVAGASDAAYATALLRAAAVAAQDERDELQVWVEHARGLAARRGLAGLPARWPLPIDLAEGELWSSVSDYGLAEASYARALAARDSALGWRGLARARDRRGDRPGACAAYRRARDLATARFPDGVVATEARGYLRGCER